MPARRLIVLLCLTGTTTTVSIGALPALLTELGVAGGLADWQIGALAGTFGLARMVSNLPVGLFITHHLGRALVLAPGLMLGGALLLATVSAFGTLALGRALMGVGHTLTMLGGLLSLLPRSVPWNAALLLACAPMTANLVLCRLCWR